MPDDIVPDDNVPDDNAGPGCSSALCPECGFDASSFRPYAVAGRLRANAAAWGRLLELPAEGLRRRSSPERWAPLEYACHVRDVCTLSYHRLELMLAEEDPLDANWDQDATAMEEDYLAQDPLAVAPELEAAGGRAGRRLRGSARLAVGASRPAE